MPRLAAIALAVFLLHSPQSEPLPPALPRLPEFAPQDHRLASVLRQGLTAKLAARLKVEAPDDPQTVRVLAQAEDYDGVIAVLRKVLDTHPDRIASAFEVLGDSVYRLRGDDSSTRQRVELLRAIIADARRRLTEMPREDAARLARMFLTLDSFVNPAQRRDWRATLDRFITDYQGTEAAALAEVDRIASGGVSQEMLDALDALIVSQPGTNAAAKALYQKGFQWAGPNMLGTLEPRGADPTDRFMRVAAIVNELESGKYPRSEWVSKGPSLIVGFFFPRDSPIAPENLDRLIAVHEEYVRKELQRPSSPLNDEHPTGSGLGYVISRKMADLYARKGQRIEGLERFLASLEQVATDPSPIRYLRALLYIGPDASERQDQRDHLAQKGRDELRTLSAAGAGLYHRKALATLANLEFQRGTYAMARDDYRRYAASYPQSEWSWVALVRAGHCEEQLGAFDRALASYLEAANMHRAVPMAAVLGHEYAARVLEVQGQFGRAVAEHQRALDRWDSSFGPRYSTYPPQPPTTELFQPREDPYEVLRDIMPTRIAQLKQTLAWPGGSQLERGRSLLTRGKFEEAATELEDVAASYAKSPAAGQARELAHRARLERALTLADVERADANETEALTQLESLSGESIDFAVTAARIVRASILWKRGDRDLAAKLMSDALSQWHAHQRPRVPGTELEKDVAAIRRAVFKPLGGEIYAIGRWNAFSWPVSAPPFMLVNSEVAVKAHDGEAARVKLVQEFSIGGKVVFFDTAEIGLLKTMMTRLGGTKRRAPTHVMETPNQPVGDPMQVLKLWTQFFPARPGHWGGWELETYPVITEIRFADQQRTRASALVTIGYSGATVELEKQAGQWIAKRLTSMWIT